MNPRYAVLALGFVLALAGCGSTCDNAGVAVDGKGAIVVFGANGFISPNSSIVAHVTSWPHPPGSEQSLVSQGYALTPDGSMYVLANSYEHPNLVYRMDLARGHATLMGNSARSSETFIASDARYVYSVDQSHAMIRRVAVSSPKASLKPLIEGPKTKLGNPIA